LSIGAQRSLRYWKGWQVQHRHKENIATNPSILNDLGLPARYEEKSWRIPLSTQIDLLFLFLIPKKIPKPLTKRWTF